MAKTIKEQLAEDATAKRVHGRCLAHRGCSCQAPHGITRRVGYDYCACGDTVGVHETIKQTPKEADPDE